MNLDEQLQVLAANAPQDGTTPALVEAIAPVLKHLALRLRHAQYYVVQTLDGDWVFTTIEHQTQSDLSKNVIYAFPTLKDAAAGPYSIRDPQFMAVPIPVTHILFQLLAITTVDSVVFFDTPDNLAAGTEIQREEINEFIQQHLIHQQSTYPSAPPNIA